MLTVFAFSGSWWTPVVRGIMAIAFGTLAFTLTFTTVTAVVLAFGVYVLADGLFTIAAAIANRHKAGDWWVLLLQGIVSACAGLAAFFYPILTAVVLLWYVAAWAIVLGALQAYAAIRLRNDISFEGWLALGGIVSVAFGILLLMQPVRGAVAALWVIASYSIAWGVLLLIGGLRLRTRRPAIRSA